jgi:acyl-CoA thioesterase FadM
VAGFWRNLLTFLIALFKRNPKILQTGCDCTFWVTPFDVGVRTLKSDRYLQIAEAAQIDFGVRSGLLKRMRRARCSMVNVEQQIHFMNAIKLFSRVRVHTSIVSVDAKFVHFLHAYSVKDHHCANVMVKAKFKSGRITQSASDLTGLVLTLPKHFDQTARSSMLALHLKS